MARLNEPPVAPAPSTESLDVVKRRFLRQNRELAKTNSQQSIRIRTLENDCSRLLAENLSLREQVLQLQNAIETQPQRPSFDNIDLVKNRLEAKVQELGNLVAELGQLQKAHVRPPYKTEKTATKPSVEERQWRSGLGLQEVENAMMPTITEDKFYPRRTMNADELQNILNDQDSQSPDIGPPPVSRVENEEPVTFNPSPLSETSPDEPVEDPDPAMSANLETRKKRRESGPKTNIRRVSVFESSSEDAEEAPSKIVRAGAKRKFSVQEDDDKAQPQTEGFRFNRRNVADASGNDRTNRASNPLSSERPALTSKPVNTDPVLSPKKQRPSKQDKPEKKPLSKSTRSRLIISRNVVQPEPQLMQMPETAPAAEGKLESLPPKTPAPEDIFSPPSAEPSTSRQTPKDTPPPGEIHAEDQTGMSARPSRRARPQVSYKEPSLNTKMRRPGKELVDAIYPHGSGRPSIEPQSAPSTSERVAIKSEPGNSTSWNSMSHANGRGGNEEVEQGSPLRQKLDRKEGGQDTKPAGNIEPLRLNPATASTTISALMNASSITKRKAATTISTTHVQEELESSEKAARLISTNKGAKCAASVEEKKLAIFDFTDSSPQDKADPQPLVDLAKVARNVRRHSSVQASSGTEERKSEAELKRSNGALPSLHSRTGSGNMRSASSTSLSKSMNAARTASKERRAVAPADAGSADLRAKLERVEDVKGSSNGTASLRAERAASRRKSMML